MNRFVIHRYLSPKPKALFRVTGHPMYALYNWDVAKNKEEIIAYLSQIRPDIIVIGEIEGMSTKQVALYIKQMYEAAQLTIPNEIYSFYDVDIDTIYDLFCRKTTEIKKQQYRQQLQKHSITKTPA